MSPRRSPAASQPPDRILDVLISAYLTAIKEVPDATSEERLRDLRVVIDDIYDHTTIVSVLAHAVVRLAEGCRSD